MKRALIVASVASMIDQFNMSNISILNELGYKIDVATNFLNPGTIDEKTLNQLKVRLNKLNVNCLQVDFPRGVGSIKVDRECYKKLKTLSKNNYTLVHCHSPIGGVLTRLAFKNTKTKIIYTAHGFHFYKGGPIRDWLLFYPIEKYLSKYTDVLITINNEDTSIAKKFSAKKTLQIPGVGVQKSKFNLITLDKNKVKQELGIGKDSTVMISVGELRDLKNHITGIKALAHLNKSVYYIICGSGELKRDLVYEAEKLGVANRVIFTGYTTELSKYFAISDISLFLSKREGLGLAGLEAMAAGIPLISSYVGGIKDYTENGKTGFTILDPVDFMSVKNAINKWINLNQDKKDEMSAYCKIIANKYSQENVNKVMKKIYKDSINYITK
ncbi:glycosyltransferase [Enterococcus faecium]|uniref:glycosyltransferase n=2 Tax=Enterococcus faecium TaxID=1352 RepID=UPI000CF2EDAF|nr:glycosyltransferase [Enterococcus faecium]MDW3728101.1 glycosyltransferase [Enterococcus faecium]PQF12422.1 glycosyltransferase family 1 protein [Enterococcus faecium]PQF67858.1 glycosyltransferase family 1 protein [Enterococcus faecium]PQH03436.1 glycosyltransferase family 1 protein [Enterococcus faecium]ROW94675.1 glycosyltransferase [Enterococcus faecium]